MTDFSSKTYLITGGGSGIGLATARRLLDEGANVVIVGRGADRLDAAVKELDSGDRVLAVTADVARPTDLDGVVERVRERFGELHGVFANAGIGLNARTADVTEEDFDRVVGTNFKGAFFTVQKALPLLAEGSSVVLNASWLVHRGMGPGSVYAASKAAVLNLPRTLAPDLADRGIRVNAVTPGHIRTEMFDAVAPVEEAREFFRGQVALGSLGTPRDIAETVLFLLSPRAAYITGQEFVVDGGLVGSVPA
ncbi:SDR family NAD(P)-dependent oxidoreductase [Streptomyces alkaliphilus]|uniref:SDR family NAD(P)-dependent oxidoreductase n=1 Tax=Streptomyces alkaliphilus TaxID=1472722 RepID=UPI00117C34B8|nr:glucose 1-dehydrogenase [Streptomyces alkaliphilus]MQS06674.1 glucose 1-dehydrogenase [Streptomyces alkaliphilus]